MDNLMNEKHPRWNEFLEEDVVLPDGYQTLESNCNEDFTHSRRILASYAADLEKSCGFLQKSGRLRVLLALSGGVVSARHLPVRLADRVAVGDPNPRRCELCLMKSRQIGAETPVMGKRGDAYENDERNETERRHKPSCLQGPATRF